MNIINSVENNYTLKLDKFPFEGGTDKEFEFMQVELKGSFIKEKLMYFFKSNMVPDQHHGRVKRWH